MEQCVGASSCYNYVKLISCEGCMESHKRWWNDSGVYSSLRDVWVNSDQPLNDYIIILWFIIKGEWL